MAAPKTARRTKARSPRITVNLPGHLRDVVRHRADAEGYEGQSEYVLGLILWDIYSRQNHDLTGPLMKQPFWKVSGFVRELLAALGEPKPAAGDVVPYRFSVTVPDTLVDLVETRRKEEGYKSASAYATGLVLFDLKRRAPDPKKVPHHKTSALLRMPDSIKCWAFVHIATGFGNPARVWPKDIQSKIDDIVSAWASK